MNTNSINRAIERGTGLKKSEKKVDYTRDSGNGNIAYRLNKVDRWRNGDFHVAKYYQNTFDFYFDNVDAKKHKDDVIKVLTDIGCTNIIDNADRGFIKFDTPKENIMNSYKIKPKFPEDDGVRFPEELAKESAEHLKKAGYDASVVDKYYVQVNGDVDESELSRWGTIMNSRIIKSGFEVGTRVYHNDGYNSKGHMYDSFGSVTKIIDDNTVEVRWDSGKTEERDVDTIYKVNSSRQIKSAKGKNEYVITYTKHDMLYGNDTFTRTISGDNEEDAKESFLKIMGKRYDITIDNIKLIQSSRRPIESARYIATDPETGEVLGSADTYEEAVNQWGEDVTITDSEVGNETDTTQGGILSSWDNDTPRGEGWLAHDDGKQKNECPYERGTDEYEDWIDGWEAAYQEVDSSKESNYKFNQRIVNSVLTKEITEDDAIKQIASRNNMNIGFAKRILSNLLEDKSLIQSGVMEMADDINKDFDLNGDLYSWFDDYVNFDGKATTVGGELVRAAHRIIERFENDGDKIGMGYGKETVNPAARYILAICNDYIDRNDIEEMLYNESRINYSDEEYDAWIQQFERTFEDYLRNHEELFHAPNKNDMWDYKEEENDVNSSVSECCIYDDEGNEYWFQKDDDGWKCTSIEYTSDPKYKVDDYVDDLYDIPDTSDDFCDFELDGFEYSAERASNGEDWIITNVSIDNGLADVNDIWETEDFEGYGIFDANGREINVSDLY